MLPPPTLAATPADPAAAPWPLLAALLLAACVPTLLALNQPPSATLLNQCLAVALWGGVAVVLPPGGLSRSLAPLLAALGVLVPAGWCLAGGVACRCRWRCWRWACWPAPH